jgi:hypothetical protein
LELAKAWNVDYSARAKLSPEMRFDYVDELGEPNGRFSQVVAPLCDAIVSNFKSWRKHAPPDAKQSWYGTLIYGPAGTGKSRLLLELLNELGKFLKGGACTELLEMLNTSDVLTLRTQLMHNGSQLTATEASWPAEQILGIRLATQYYLPGEMLSRVRDVLELLPSLRMGVTLTAVVKWIASERDAPKVLHFAVDEIQESFRYFPVYAGSRVDGPNKETLFTAILRALLNAIPRSPQSMFLICTMAGTALSLPDDALPPTGYPFTSCRVLPLLPQSALELVSQMKVRYPLGDLRYAQLCAALGGLPRVYETLEKVLDAEPDSVPLLPVGKVFELVCAAVKGKLLLHNWSTGDRGRALLLAAVGVTIPIAYPTICQVIPFRELQLQGLVSAKRVESTELVSLPLVIVYTVLTQGPYYQLLFLISLCIIS